MDIVLQHSTSIQKFLGVTLGKASRQVLDYSPKLKANALSLWRMHKGGNKPDEELTELIAQKSGSFLATSTLVALKAALDLETSKERRNELARFEKRKLDSDKQVMAFVRRRIKEAATSNTTYRIGCDDALKEYSDKINAIDKRVEKLEKKKWYFF